MEKRKRDQVIKQKEEEAQKKKSDLEIELLKRQQKLEQVRVIGDKGGGFYWDIWLKILFEGRYIDLMHLYHNCHCSVSAHLCRIITLSSSGGVEKAMAPHSSTLAWKVPWTEEPGRLQSMGSRRVRQDWATSLSLFTFMSWRRKWQPTPVFLPGKSQGWGSLMGCHLWGRTEPDTTEVT